MKMLMHKLFKRMEFIVLRCKIEQTKGRGMRIQVDVHALHALN